jgi:short-subunit dehydrogenase
MPDWNQKVVLVTGGSAGLGRAIAAEFAQRGAQVVIAGRDADKLQAAAKSLSGQGAVSSIPADVTRDDDVARLIEQTLARQGRLDVVVNNAGRSARGALADTPLAEYRELWELNFLALVRVTQQALPALRATQGHLVNIGSLASKSAARYMGAYATSKFPVAAFSQQLRMELADDGVHVLLVCPGPIARADAGARYAEQAAGLPDAAQKPGGGVKLSSLRAEYVAQRIVRACERRQPELVIPWKARLLFAISQLSPAWGDWLLRKMT